MSTSDSRTDSCHPSLVARIQNEFLEMPGLRLTCLQAQRLWALEYRTCADALDILVERHFLTRHSDGRYGRAFDGAPNVRPRMAKVVPHQTALRRAQ